MTHTKCSPSLIHVCLLLAVALTFAVPASAEWNEKVLYSFQGGTTDGAFPAGGVVFDPQGNLYGVLQDYGPGSCAPIGNECGAVFQLTPPAQKGGAWTETLIYTFQGKGSNDGESPNGGLLIDGQGNLYGVTAYGGTGDCVLLGVPAGCGTVYEISPPKQKGGAWTETILYSFPTTKQGYFPIGNLVFDKVGNLYGATTFGGTRGTTCDPFYGGQCGVVFELNPPKTNGGKWTEEVLHNFASGTDGANPNGGLVLDGAGNVYGTTYAGGSQGRGTVFKLKPPATKGSPWTEKVVYRFNPARSYEAWPMDGLIMDKEGHLFGTTHEDTVFRLVPSSKKPGSWTETILYSYKGKGPSYALDAPLIFDSAGNLYSTVYAGSGGSVNGNVFKLRPPSGKGKDWTIDVLHDFVRSPDGEWPAAGLVFGKSGSLYGTTQAGGTGQACQSGCGTVFKVWP
jgi:uncharacterized repeat protein (TIGR03803 family)